MRLENRIKRLESRLPQSPFINKEAEREMVAKLKEVVSKSLMKRAQKVINEVAEGRTPSLEIATEQLAWIDNFLKFDYLHMQEVTAKLKQAYDLLLEILTKSGQDWQSLFASKSASYKAQRDKSRKRIMDDWAKYGYL